MKNRKQWKIKPPEKHLALAGKKEEKPRKKADSTLRSSQAVPHPSTKRALSKEIRCIRHGMAVSESVELLIRSQVTVSKFIISCGPIEQVVSSIITLFALETHAIAGSTPPVALENLERECL